MKPGKRLSELVLCVSATLFFSLISIPLHAASSKLFVKPDLVRVGALYKGTRINISAEIPRGCDVVVEVIGKDIRETVVQKVRRLGLWMNGEGIVVRGAPCLYLAMSSKPNLLTNPSATALWGYEALKKRVSFSGHIKETDTGRVFSEFLRLKESLQLYGIFPGALKVSSSSGNRSTVRGFFQLSSHITPGSYQVSLSVIKNGGILLRESIPLEVVMVGFPELVYYMAMKHAVIYGFLAIVITTLSGLVVGLVFAKSKPRRD